MLDLKETKQLSTNNVLRKSIPNFPYASDQQVAAHKRDYFNRSLNKRRNHRGRQEIQRIFIFKEYKVLSR